MVDRGRVHLAGIETAGVVYVGVVAVDLLGPLEEALVVAPVSLGGGAVGGVVGQRRGLQEQI